MAQAAPQRIIDLARTTGITAEEQSWIGSLLMGRDILGEIVQEGGCLQVPDIVAGPRAIRFTPHHPPMHTLLGLPIVLDDHVIGNLYVTQRRDGERETTIDHCCVVPRRVPTIGDRYGPLLLLPENRVTCRTSKALLASSLG